MQIQYIILYLKQSFPKNLVQFIEPLLEKDTKVYANRFHTNANRQIAFSIQITCNLKNLKINNRVSHLKTVYLQKKLN